MDKVYYGNSINLSGLYSKKPVRCDSVATYDNNKYWDKDGDFCVDINKLGIEYKECIVTFSSENEKEVQIWTDGVLATMKMLKSWCK
jgi:hypothetical protein